MGFFQRRQRPTPAAETPTDITLSNPAPVRRRGTQPVPRGPSPSHPPEFDVFSDLTQKWGRGQTLLGFTTRLRCDQRDAAGWEFRRSSTTRTNSPFKPDDDDTALQIVGLRWLCPSTVVWNLIRDQYHDVDHEDFERLGVARFTALDHTGSPVCLFRVGHLVVRIRMTGTLAHRQYTRIYALDVAQHLDQAALQAWTHKAIVAVLRESPS